METWQFVPGFEGEYEVSTLGRLRSHVLGQQRILRCAPDSRGYIPVFLYGKRQRKRYWLHRLIAEVFIPNPQQRREVNHKNGNKSDCRVENLEWVSRSQNIRHAYENGLVKYVGKRGADSNKAVLTNEQVLQLRKLYEEREYTQRELAEMFNISRSTVYQILKRRSWSHI